MTQTTDLLNECEARSIELLLRNLTPEGILAATPTPLAEERRYTRIFGRDGAICALGMAISPEERLRQGAFTTLRALANHQADNGQIPKYIDPQHAESDFWYVGCIDATLWWLIAVKLIDALAPGQDLEEQLRPHVDKALAWLHCQEHPRLNLLQQNEASDWADIMPRSGFVLYTNALWYYVKRLYNLPNRDETKYHFNHLFFPFSRDVPEYRRLRLLTHYVLNNARNRDLYLSFVNLSFWGEEGDVFGNLLAVLLGLADEGSGQRILHALNQAHITTPHPVRAVTLPIGQDSPLWRTYMERHRQNLPYQYHNGGCWPFIGAFHALTLARAGQPKQALDALNAIARANRQENWQFNEWFHGQTGSPCGMPGQSWNGAMFLLARYGMDQRVF